MKTEVFAIATPVVSVVKGNMAMANLEGGVVVKFVRDDGQEVSLCLNERQDVEIVKYRDCQTYGSRTDHPVMYYGDFSERTPLCKNGEDEAVAVLHGLAKLLGYKLTPADDKA